jgi:hypothetical protein
MAWVNRLLGNAVTSPVAGRLNDRTRGEGVTRVLHRRDRDQFWTLAQVDDRSRAILGSAVS